MNKIKKIIISIAISIITICCFHTNSFSWEVNKSYNISHGGYGDTIYCVEYLETSPVSDDYTVVSIIKFQGIEATDHLGKTLKSKENAKMAYILCQESDHGTGGSRNLQHAIWNYFKTWLDSVGELFHGISGSFADHDSFKSPYLKEGEDYKNGLAENLEINDKTKKDELTFKTREIDNKKYERIGPFNWEFPETLSSIQVHNESKENINGVKYSRFDGTEEKMYSSISEIKSGKNFYIWIPFSSKTQKITTITGQIYQNVKTVTLICLKNDKESYQNYITREDRRRDTSICRYRNIL